MIDKLWESTSEVVRERLASPIVGPFVTSWCVANYKFFVVLFSANSVTATFDHVARLYPDSAARWGSLYWPAAITLLYVLVLPYVEWAALWASLKAQKQVVHLRREHAHVNQLSEADSKKLRDENHQLRLDMKIDADRKDLEIENLKGELDAALKRLGPRPENERLPLSPDLSEVEQVVLDLIAGTSMGAERSLILSAGLGRAIEVDLALRQLIQRGAIIDGRGESGDEVYKATSLGNRITSKTPPSARLNVARAILTALATEPVGLSKPNIIQVVAPDAEAKPEIIDFTLAEMEQQGLIEISHSDLDANLYGLTHSGRRVQMGKQALPAALL